MTTACTARKHDPITSRIAGTASRSRQIRAVLLCLVYHGPISAPWIEARLLRWMCGSTIRGCLVALERSGLAERIPKAQRSPHGFWARMWRATRQGRASCNSE